MFPLEGMYLVNQINIFLHSNTFDNRLVAAVRAFHGLSQEDLDLHLISGRAGHDALHEFVAQRASPRLASIRLLQSFT